MSKKIFIIEDDVNILYALQAKFRVEGFEIEGDSGNGEMAEIEIMSKMKRFKPDIVITDLILPKVDGFEIIKSIKSDPELRDVMVFVFSNLSDMDSRERGTALGIDLYAVKQKFTVDSFIESVEKVLRNKGVDF